MSRARSESSDRGGVALEYGAVIVLVAAIFGTVILVAPFGIAENIRVVVCRLFGGSCEVGGPPKTDADFRPKLCERSSSEEKFGATIKIAVIKVGDEYTFLRQEFADGSVRLTVVPSNFEIGLETGVGANASLGKNLKLGADVTIGGSIKVGQGDTYVFRNAEEAAEFEDDIREISYRDAAKDLADPTGIFSPVTDWIDDHTGRPDIKDPEIQATTITLKAGVEGVLGLKLPKSDPEKFVNLNTGLSVKREVGAEFAVIDDRSDPDNPKTHYSLQLNGTIGHGGQVLGAGGEHELRWTGTEKFTYNDRGELSAITFQTTYEKAAQWSGKIGGDTGGKATDKNKTVETVTMILPITNDTDRRVVRNWLADHPLELPTSILRRMTGDDGVITTDPGSQGDPFDRLVYNNGMVLNQTSENETDGWEVGAEAKLGLVLGFEVHSENSENRSVEAEYLGAPRNGHREFIPYPNCVEE